MSMKKICELSRRRHKGPVISLDIIHKAQHSANILFETSFSIEAINLLFLLDLPEDK